MHCNGPVLYGSSWVDFHWIRGIRRLHYVRTRTTLQYSAAAITRNDDDDGETNALAPLAPTTTTITVIGAYTRSPRNETALYEQKHRDIIIYAEYSVGAMGAHGQ